MSFPPGVRLPMTRPLYATSSVPSGTMMVQMAPVRPVTMVPVSQVVVRSVMRPVISQSQAAFVPAMRPRAVGVLTNQPILQTAAQPVWIQSAEPQKSAIITKPPELKKEVNTPVEQNGAEAPSEPAITVFVGNITDRASDTLIRQILMKCGSVYAWKRVQGPSGKLQAFGFCEYRDPESALRAIRILHNYTIGDKKLLVKVDAKTQELIDEWKKQKGMEVDDNESSNLSGVDEALSGIENLVLGYSSELAVPRPAGEKEETSQGPKPDLLVRESNDVKENLDELQLEEEQKNFISKEIRTFRESQMLQEERSKFLRSVKEKLKNRDIVSRDRSRVNRNEHDDYSRRARRSRSSSRRSRSISPRSSEHRRSPPRRRSRTPPRALLIRRVSPRRSPRRRSRSPRRRRSSSRSPSWRRSDEEDVERRKLEKKIKEKEAAYQERLHTLENRERRQKRAYEKRVEQEKAEREAMVKEAKKLREFLADYDDEKCDSIYYSGSMLTKRLSDREREMEEDAQDKRKEAEEISILRKKLVEENHTSPDAAITTVIAETENIWRPLIEPDTPPKTPSSVDSDSSSSSTTSDEDSDSIESESDDSESQNSDDQSVVYETEIVNEDVSAEDRTEDTKAKIKDNIMSHVSSADSPSVSSTASSTPKFKASFKLKQEGNPVLSNSKKRNPSLSDVFNQDDNETPHKKAAKPQLLDEKNSKHEKKDKRKLVRALIEKIPTEKEELFDYDVLWSMADATLMERRIKPWISKKIIEYIGEDEPTLVEFICSKISSKSKPGKILDDISMVLDEEAEVFVVKLWRLLIYETEAKNEGLTN